MEYNFSGWEGLRKFNYTDRKNIKLIVIRSIIIRDSIIWEHKIKYVIVLSKI